MCEGSFYVCHGRLSFTEPNFIGSLIRGNCLRKFGLTLKHFMFPHFYTMLIDIHSIDVLVFIKLF